MKHCQHCGANFDDTIYSTCPYCRPGSSEEPVDGYTMPPAVPGTPGSGLPQKSDPAPPSAPTPLPEPARRRSPRFVWLLAGAAAVVLTGLVIWLAFSFATKEEEKTGDDAPAAVTAVPGQNPSDEQTGDFEEEAPAAPVGTLSISGTMNLETANDGTAAHGTSSVRFALSVNAGGEVRGSLVRDGKDVGIAGFYHPDSGSLVLYDDSGDNGRYEGCVSGGTYAGKFIGVSGTWNFNLSVQ